MFFLKRFWQLSKFSPSIQLCKWPGIVYQFFFTLSNLFPSMVFSFFLFGFFFFCDEIPVMVDVDQLQWCPALNCSRPLWRFAENFTLSNLDLKTPGNRSSKGNDKHRWRLLIPYGIKTDDVIYLKLVEQNVCHFIMQYQQIKRNSDGMNRAGAANGPRMAIYFQEDGEEHHRFGRV